MSKSKTTSRKTRFVASKNLVDADTGEELEAQVVEVEDRDFNFKKLWLGHILEAINEMGSAKMKVLMWLFDSMNYENTVLATVREVAEGSEVSIGTVTSTLQLLDEHDVVRRRTGAVLINPNVIFRGGHGKRMNVLMRYREAGQKELFDEPGGDGWANWEDGEEPELRDGSES